MTIAIDLEAALLFVDDLRYDCPAHPATDSKSADIIEALVEKVRELEAAPRKNISMLTKIMTAITSNETMECGHNSDMVDPDRDGECAVCRAERAEKECADWQSLAANLRDAVQGKTK